VSPFIGPDKPRLTARWTAADRNFGPMNADTPGINGPTSGVEGVRR
jgi:hypothetical protein